MAEKGGEESGRDENSVEKRFEKVDMRQIKENMGDRMNIVVENLVSLPKEDREKVLSHYISMKLENIDDKDEKMAEMAVRWAVDKLAEEKAAERERIVTEAQRGHYADPSQARGARAEESWWSKEVEQRRKLEMSKKCVDMMHNEGAKERGNKERRREKEREGERRREKEREGERRREKEREGERRGDKGREGERRREKEREGERRREKEREGERRREKGRQGERRREKEREGERRREKEREGERRREKERRRDEGERWRTKERRTTKK